VENDALDERYVALNRALTGPLFGCGAPVRYIVLR
jgi:hypothetical protein